MKKPYAIIIMDGYGLNPSNVGNAIVTDGSKYVNELMQKYPSATLGASGMAVGLPDGQMGNSEVGHLNIGAGRIVYQDLTKLHFRKYHILKIYLLYLELFYKNNCIYSSLALCIN